MVTHRAHRKASRFKLQAVSWQPMAYHNLEPFSKQLTIVVGLSVVGFMAFGLALSFYRNVLFEQTLANMKIRNDAIRLDIEQGHRNLEYRSEERRVGKECRSRW